MYVTMVLEGTGARIKKGIKRVYSDRVISKLRIAV